MHSPVPSGGKALLKNSNLHLKDRIFTLCACAARGRSDRFVCQSVRQAQAV